MKFSEKQFLERVAQQPEHEQQSQSPEERTKLKNWAKDIPKLKEENEQATRVPGRDFGLIVRT